jgi:ankyrin repeat protein
MLPRTNTRPSFKILLFASKIDVESKDNLGRTPLSYATENGHGAIFILLLNTGKFDLKVKDNSGRTPLLYAAKNRNEVIVKALLDTVLSCYESVVSIIPRMENSSDVSSLPS